MGGNEDELLKSTYEKCVTKVTTKPFLKKILIAAKENANKDNRIFDDLIFEPSEIEIIDQIINQADRNAPFEDFIFNEDTIEVLDYVIGNIYGTTMAEPIEPIFYVSSKFNLSLSQNEYEILEELKYCLADIKN